MEKVKFGIIGVGNMGSAHFANFMKGAIKNGEVVAVADLLQEKLDSVKQKGKEQNPEAEAKVSYFHSGDELIEAGVCEAVMICVPHYFHPTFAIKAMQHGIHPLVEKPAGVYTNQVKEMLEEHKKHPELKLGIMFNQRTNPCFKKIKEMIANGDIGEIRRLNWIITNWYRNQTYYNCGGWRATWKGEGGGVLYNQAPHNLDLFQWIPDMMPSRVHAFCKFGQWHNIEVEDDVTAYLEYQNGATGVFITTTGDYPGSNRLEITGSKGKLVYDNGNLKWWKLNEDLSDYTFHAPAAWSNPTQEEFELSVPGEYPQHAGITNNFANAILGLEPLYAAAEDGIKGVTLANAMLMSAWTGETVELPFDGDRFYELLQQHIRDSKFVKEEAKVVEQGDFSNSYNAK